MNNFDPNGRPDRLPDADLDVLLNDVNAELLRHVQANLDHGRLLSALLAAEAVSASEADSAAVLALEGSKPQPQRGIALAIVRLRNLTAALVRDLDHACTLRDLNGTSTVRGLNRAHVIIHDLNRTLDLVRDRDRAHAVRDLDHALDHALDCAFDLARGLDRALKLDLSLDVAFELAVDRAFDRALDIDRASASPFGHGIGLGRVRAFAFTLDCTLDLDRASTLDRAFARVLILARDPKLALDGIRIDVSGVDLSTLELVSLEVLDGFVWTRQTRWPRGRIEEIRNRSQEIAKGVWQVLAGNEREDSDLVLQSEVGL